MYKTNTGVLTFWNVPNYGTYAQAYALQKVVAQCLPDSEVKQIAYLKKKHYEFYYSKFPQTSIFGRSFYRNLFKYLIPISPYNKRRNMFLNEYQKIPHTDELDSTRLSEVVFDNLILGSDIIWDYSFEVFDNDSYLFGQNIISKCKIAYAASFGTVRKEWNHPQYVIEGIKKLNAISVRDENSADIVEILTGERPKVVLDPTWLWDFEKDPNVVTPKYKDYIVVYGQDFTDIFIDEVIEYAKDNHYNLICLDCNDDNYAWCDIVIKQYELTPLEWVGFFRDAKAIVTSTYHGLTFGLIFSKKMAFCRSDFIIAKASSFLKELGLYELYNERDRSAKEMLNFQIDNEYMQKYIRNKRKESKEFLLEAIKRGCK